MSSLRDQAQEALANAYAPYSGYKVGAAIRTADGTVFTGCNVENANYSNSLHAEQLALGRAVSWGHRDFDRLAVVSSGDRIVTPCGTCRQSLAEFCDDEFEIVRGDGEETMVQTLGTLLPDAFRPTHLEDER